MALGKKDISEWRDKTAQIPLIERILESSKLLLGEIETDLVLKLAEAYRFVGKTNKARENYEKALVLSQGQSDTDREGTAFNGLGLVYTDLGEFGQAIQNFEHYLALRYRNSEALAVGYNHLGFAQYKQGEPARAGGCTIHDERWGGKMR